MRDAIKNRRLKIELRAKFKFKFRTTYFRKSRWTEPRQRPRLLNRKRPNSEDRREKISRWFRNSYKFPYLFLDLKLSPFMEKNFWIDYIFHFYQEFVSFYRITQFTRVFERIFLFWKCLVKPVSPFFYEFSNELMPFCWSLFIYFFPISTHMDVLSVLKGNFIIKVILKLTNTFREEYRKRIGQILNVIDDKIYAPLLARFAFSIINRFLFFFSFQNDEISKRGFYFLYINNYTQTQFNS